MSRVFKGRRRFVVGTLVGLGVVFACAGLTRREDRIRFSHETHVQQQGIECLECHADIQESTRVMVSSLPKEAKCLECHDKQEGQCGQCHANPKEPRTWESTRVGGVTFSHVTHIEVVEGRCEECHSDVRTARSPGETRTPRMLEVCMNCHRQDFREIRCRSCHEDLIENPVRPVRLFSHDADFRKRHAELAKGDERVCAHCHRQDFCADCHSRLEVLVPDLKWSERVDRDLPHRHDYLTRHPIEAHADPSRCWTCHNPAQCNACHQARKAGGHPPEWMNPASPAFHGLEARRDIVACAACHDQGAASNCVKCHKVGGPGGNPHPPGWGWRLDRASPMCRTCHP